MPVKSTYRVWTVDVTGSIRKAFGRLDVVDLDKMIEHLGPNDLCIAAVFGTHSRNENVSAILLDHLVVALFKVELESVLHEAIRLISMTAAISHTSALRPGGICNP